MKRTLIAIGCILAALVIFQAGIIIGHRKAAFSYRWGEQYHRNFAGPRGGFFREVRDREFIEAHGVFGQVLRADEGDLAVRGADGVERIVRIGEGTAIRRFRSDIAAGDLRPDDPIVIIGSPNADGQIEAKLIRVMPPPDGRKPMFPARKPCPR